MDWETNENLMVTDDDLTPLANLLPLNEVGLNNLGDAAWAAAERAVKVVLRRGAVCRRLLPEDGEPVYLCATGAPVSPGLSGRR